MQQHEPGAAEGSWGRGGVSLEAALMRAESGGGAHEREGSPAGDARQQQQHHHEEKEPYVAAASAPQWVHNMHYSIDQLVATYQNNSVDPSGPGPETRFGAEPGREPVEMRGTTQQQQLQQQQVAPQAPIRVMQATVPLAAAAAAPPPPASTYAAAPKREPERQPTPQRMPSAGGAGPQQQLQQVSPAPAVAPTPPPAPAAGVLREALSPSPFSVDSPVPGRRRSAASASRRQDAPAPPRPRVLLSSIQEMSRRQDETYERLGSLEVTFLRGFQAVARQLRDVSALSAASPRRDKVAAGGGPQGAVAGPWSGRGNPTARREASWQHVSWLLRTSRFEDAFSQCRMFGADDDLLARAMFQSGPVMHLLSNDNAAYAASRLPSLLQRDETAEVARAWLDQVSLLGVDALPPPIAQRLLPFL